MYHINIFRENNILIDILYRQLITLRETLQLKEL